MIEPLKRSSRQRSPIAAIDDGVGRVVVKLTEHGLLDNTLIVVTSDTGARLKMTKPDSPIDGDAVGWDVSTLDIAPSLLQLAGGNLPERALRQIE